MSVLNINIFTKTKKVDLGSLRPKYISDIYYLLLFASNLI